MSPYASSEAGDAPTLVARVRERLREDFGRKAAGIAFALTIEALLLLVLLTLGQLSPERKVAPMATVTFDVKEETQQASAPPPPKAAATRQQQPSAAIQPQPQPSPVPAPLAPPPQPATIIPVSPQQMQSLDISKLPRAPTAAAPAGPAIGPAYTPRFGDSQRVGTAPNGEAMYGASWYRKPTDQELRGYLSTAEVPAWGMIVCKTVEDYRVEDCMGLDEYPEGSHMIRAMLAAAWQFRVRPPRVNGVSQVGDWVRIRFDIDTKPANPYGTVRELPGPDG